MRLQFQNLIFQGYPFPSRTDAKGQVFQYNYDADNRVIAMDAPDTTEDITFTYDACTNGNGQLCSVSIGDGIGLKTVTYSYDTLGQISSHQGVVYQYDVNSRVSLMTYPDGTQISFAYNTVGQVSSVVLNPQTQAISLASNINYAPFGPVTDLLYGSGRPLSQTLDSAYRFTGHSD